MKNNKKTYIGNIWSVKRHIIWCLFAWKKSSAYSIIRRKNDSDGHQMISNFRGFGGMKVCSMK